MLNFLAQSYSTYDYTTTTTTSDANAGLAAGMMLIIFLAIAVFVVIAVVGMWKLFEKAGEQGWKALIPVYNTWILMEISGKPGWWALVTLIPWVGSVIYLVLFIMAMLQLAKNFGKSDTFAIIGLVIFSVVGFLILGFGDAKYTGTKYVASGPAPTPAA